MAIKLTGRFAISLGTIVESSLDAARVVHSRELATKEAAFQNAVAEGKMSYQAQLAFREDQLATPMIPSPSRRPVASAGPMLAIPTQSAVHFLTS